MDHAIEKALQLLDAGDVVGLPTETVYGLAARIDRPAGLRRIFAVKERPFFDPLIIHVADAAQARQVTAAWPAAAQALADAFWPGPLTMILPKAPSVDPLITSGLDTVGVRCPRHALARTLIQAAGVPLAAPSANKFGRTSPTTASHVRAEFGNDVFVLDGEASEIGIESTVLSVDENAGRTSLSILRAGAVTPTELSGALTKAGVNFVFEDFGDRRAAPGQLKHHYMPPVPLIWVEGDFTDEEIARDLAPQIRSLPEVWEGVRLTKPQRALSHPAHLRLDADPALASRMLYSELRRLAETGADHLIFRFDPTRSGEKWEGVLDRLRKASLFVLRRSPGGGILK